MVLIGICWHIMLGNFKIICEGYVEYVLSTSWSFQNTLT